MWIVRLALRRPYTAAVLALLIIIMGVLSLNSMLIDIFPVIDIPVVGVVWSYPGLSAEEMERRIVYISERSISTTVNGVARIESQSIPGVGIMRIYFQNGTSIGGAIAQISSVSQTALRSMPPGLTPPSVIEFNASNLPVAQLMLQGNGLSEEKIYDYALNFIRVKLFTIPGLATPAPYGGKSRQINVDVNPQLLSAKGLSTTDVTNSLLQSNLILPAGTARIGQYEYNILLNSSPLTVSAFESIPLKLSGNVPILLGDVSKVSDGFADQTNIVRVNGKRASYLNILKKADASTLGVVDRLKGTLESIKALAPQGLDISIDFDQSKFVKDAIYSVVHEAGISSLLVSLMVLFFLGSWRSVFVICTSITLAILVGVIGLKLVGNSINIMTLGGLSLAIGMLVDDATVEVENIHRNHALGLPLTVAILTGASQIALPAITATLAICIVFSPVILLSGPAKFLFTPMAEAVVFSMLASYFLSRTLVPILCRMLLSQEHHDTSAKKEVMTKWDRFDVWRLGVLDALQKHYDAAITAVMQHRKFVLSICAVVLILSGFIVLFVGRDFFPTTDTGLMKLHFRAPAGLRIEKTEEMVSRVENVIRSVVPESELSTINSMIGVPASWNLAFVPTDNIAGMDSEILIALKPDHKPTMEYMQAIRSQIKSTFPDCTAYFQSADIVNQVLNFGLSSPIDIEIEGPNVTKNYEYAKTLRDRIQEVPGAVDVNIKQVFDYPTLRLNVDRVRAARVGLTQRDFANSMLIALSSSSLISPSYYLNPLNGVNYTVAVKVPLKQMSSVQDLLLSSITPATAPDPSAGNGPSSLQGTQSTQTLGNFVNVESVSTLDSISHKNVQRIIDITANLEGRDLGGVIHDIKEKIAQLGKLPPGVAINIRGQNEIMEESFTNLGIGLILAIVLVFLLMVVLFQSWLDPFIVLTAVPGALVGILWTLLMTGTTINVVSFMGSIMAVGIAASNSILLVSFANDVRNERPLSASEAALEAGKTRLRPVLMTALAMIIGMIPTALGLGEGGEQNAPLGRAVIGGLITATIVTLFLVPIIYSYLRQALPTKHLLEARFAAESEGKEFIAPEAL